MSRKPLVLRSSLVKRKKAFEMNPYCHSKTTGALFEREKKCTARNYLARGRGGETFPPFI